MLSYQQAREMVIDRVRGVTFAPAVEMVPLQQALMRVLARGICSDRDYPPFDRSIRDGYAVKAADTGAGKTLEVIGELKAGDSPSISVAHHTCIQIMTGAPLPDGADAVVMIEHTSRDGHAVQLGHAVKPGQHVVHRGSEQAAGQTVLTASTRMGFAEIAAAAQVGAAQVSVYRKPRIAILSTGDEVVDFAAMPGPFQIRNSNSVSLQAQVFLSGAEPVALGNAKDSIEDLRAKISAGLEADALILSGGVSMGKYDLVEPVLRELDAEIVFDAVAIRPGKPVVFALCKGKSFETPDKPVFGLPGNPVSTMVTFDLFVRPAIDILSGTVAGPLPFVGAVLDSRLSEKPGLTHFLPAKLTWTADAPRVSPIPWQGSGDVVAMAHANCLLVVPSNRETMEASEQVHVVPRGLW
jgi:molybdopterin molybdotransferase